MIRTATVWMSSGLARAVAIAALALLATSTLAIGDDELDAHLKAQRKQLQDPSLPLPRRAELALEMAATLDRVAHAAASPDERRERWAEAIAQLDAFNADQPLNQRRHEIAFQAAVYLWATAQSWVQQADLIPTDATARSNAAKILDATCERLRAIESSRGEGPPALEPNRRFRLAQALADRARLAPEGSPERASGLDRALALLEVPFNDPGLQGFGLLLRADVLLRLGRGDDAQAEVRKAAKLATPPPPGALLEEQVEVAIARDRFEEALEAIGAAGPIDPATRDLLTVRTRLAHRDWLPPGPSRSEAEAEAFRHAQALRESGAPQAQRATLALARDLKEPDDTQGPEAWDLLAEGALALGQIEHASDLEIRGAAKAEADGKREQAASFRNRAGAILFQSGQFGRADAILTRVFDDPEAGAIRARAGLLRTYARARALAGGEPGTSLESYLAALEAQIEALPDDPTAAEARWLLGKARHAGRDRAGALAAWSGIVHGSPRWLDARLEIAREAQEAVDLQRLNDDRAESRRLLGEAERSLDEALALADPSERPELEFRRVRLALTPGLGDPAQARDGSERLLKSSGRADQRDRAHLLLVVALAQTGEFVDAEREARDVGPKVPIAERLDAARLLDRSGASSDSDLFLRRYGHLIRILAGQVLERGRSPSPAAEAEARLRLIRGLLFTGSFNEARRSLMDGSTNWAALPPELLDDLADTYVRLDAHDLAIDVYRLQARQSQPGTLPWFAARYGQALAYYRANRPAEARRLIDATAILHPDLGGGELRKRFERLRQRLQ